MKKIKFVMLSLVAAMSIGFTTQASKVQASEVLEMQAVNLASDTLYVERLLPHTSEKQVWITVVSNGTTYSGYIYNRGIAVDKGGVKSFFTGELLAGPYAPTLHNPEK
ncbi:hypothetical protein [Sporosarcina sp. Te-1]|uniref:hypothetical protein n=1 Tax=Sporosarcina sp. Te-1 TaxID=2818390 RepID=UPI001A9CF7AD|nr:hypothetical protein [Sporosarcina sp. Te-1]QTD42775.1 hypothetical protein J3U78_08415 [Sporosarcina sp. Te-1]